MDKAGGSSPHFAPKNTRRVFFQWAVKWFYANLPENTSEKPDIATIICILRAIGFQLQKFEKPNEPVSNDELDPSKIRITLECGASKMIAVLEMNDIVCDCPVDDEDKDGSFWSITGSGPTGSMQSINKIEETGSNLLPKMSKETENVVRDVLHKLLKLMNNKADINHNTDVDVNVMRCTNNGAITAEQKEGLTRSCTDLYMTNYKPRTFVPPKKILLMSSKFGSSKSVKETDKSNLKKKDAGSALSKDKSPSIPKLTRQGTYDLDNNTDNSDEPRGSPLIMPSNASILYDQFSSASLSQISLQSEPDEALNLADYVVKAHQILDKAVNLIMNKMPLDISNLSSSTTDDYETPDSKMAKFSSFMEPPLRSSSFCISPKKVTNSRVQSFSGNVNNVRGSARASLGSATANSTLVRRAASATLGQSSNFAVPAAVPKRRNSATNSATAASTIAQERIAGRSNSLGSRQRIQPKTTVESTAISSIASRFRNAATGSDGIASKVSPLSAQRTGMVLSKPPIGKLGTANRLSTNTTAGDGVLSRLKTSPNSKVRSSLPQPRTNVSLTKISTTSKPGLNSTKYGFVAAKK